MGESLTGHIGTNKNYSDLATKVLYYGKHNISVSSLLYEIYDDLWEFNLQSLTDMLLEILLDDS